MDRVDTTIAVDTPERVRFRTRIAGPGQRAAALLLDLILQGIVVAMFGAAAALSFAGGELIGGATVGLALLVVFVVSWLYGAAFEWAMGGQTPGKWVLGLRVTRADGAPIGAREALLRNLVRGADALPVGYVVAAIVTFIDPRMRRLGDLVAGTIVVAERGQELADEVRIEPPVSEAERRALPPRVELDPDARRAIEAWIRSRDRLSPERIEELASILGPDLAGPLGVPGPPWSRALTLVFARATGRDR